MTSPYGPAHHGVAALLADRFGQIGERLAATMPSSTTEDRERIVAAAFAEMIGPTGTLDVRFPGPAGEAFLVVVHDPVAHHGPFHTREDARAWASNHVITGSWVVMPLLPAHTSPGVAPPRPVAYRLTMTCNACPTQYDVDVEDGAAYAYFRYRSGWCSLELYPNKAAHGTIPALARWEEQLGDDLDGVMEEEQVIDLVSQHLPRLVAEARSHGSPIAAAAWRLSGGAHWSKL